MIPGAAVWDAYQNPQSRSCSAFVAGNLNSPELREFIEVLLAYTSNGSRPSRAESFEKFGHLTQKVHSLHARIDDGGRRDLKTAHRLCLEQKTARPGHPAGEPV